MDNWSIRLLELWRDNLGTPLVGLLPLVKPCTAPPPLGLLDAYYDGQQERSMQLGWASRTEEVNRSVVRVSLALDLDSIRRQRHDGENCRGATEVPGTGNATGCLQARLKRCRWLGRDKRPRSDP